MKREQIEQWASAAGWRVDSYTNSKERILTGLMPSSLEQVERFAALVAAHEREQCALVCEARSTPGTGSVAILNGAADAIRART